LFGCGGDRDAGKRPLMGEVATRLADRVYVTDDNPRTEAPAEIRRAILEVAPSAIEIGDRREAIATAIAELGAGDLLVIAGKGHETGQIIGTETYPFDDAAIARELGGASRRSSRRLVG
jgi:UDP-N-acetylmuramoyl-L-alanyl-D-glutamate--2,6-diaminopimelate ligase